jgi:hypothetical protein
MVQSIQTNQITKHLMQTKPQEIEPNQITKHLMQTKTTRNRTCMFEENNPRRVP